jgi:hypothetical protein
VIKTGKRHGCEKLYAHLMADARNVMTPSTLDFKIVKPTSESEKIFAKEQKTY